ncbi:MAG: B12-binding domain-containing radical SAM protein [Desulfomonile tiedjei]|nr:B12-binding domain-containing radical SAM protein [Desulfomonile tiedjei]
MRIVLATPPADGESDGSVGGLPPLGLLYLYSSAATLPDTEVHIVDATVENLNTPEAVERVLALEPDVFGVSVLSTNICRGLKLLKGVKQRSRSVTTVLGGVHATLFDKQLLEETPELDLVMRGEAEQTFVDLCTRLMDGTDIAGVQGLSYRRGAEIVRGEPQIVEDLDALPFPDWNALDLSKYFQRFSALPLWGVHKSAAVLTSRGCPYRCSFCSRITADLGKWRARSAENVFQELVQLSENGFTDAFLVDENTTASVSRLEKLCELLIERNLDMRFACDGSLHHLSESTLKLMRRAGFDVITVGVESGSDEQLKRFNKPANSKALAAGIKRAKKAHFWVHSFFIAGGPGETASDHEASKRFLSEVAPHSGDFQWLTVFPGSQLWNQFVGGAATRPLSELSPRPIYELSKEPDENTIRYRVNDLIRVFLRTWFRWNRLGEFVGLIRNNPFVRRWAVGALKNLPHFLRTAHVIKTAARLPSFDPGKYMALK